MEKKEKIYCGNLKKSGDYGMNGELNLTVIFQKLLETGDEKQLAWAFNVLYNAAKTLPGFFAGESKKNPGEKLLKIKLSITENKDKQYSDYSISINEWTPETKKTTDTPVAPEPPEIDDLPF